MVHPLKVSLEDLYLGTTKKLSLSRNVICSKCSGYVLMVLVDDNLLTCICVCAHVAG